MARSAVVEIKRTICLDTLHHATAHRPGTSQSIALVLDLSKKRPWPIHVTSDSYRLGMRWLTHSLTQLTSSSFKIHSVGFVVLLYRSNHHHYPSRPPQTLTSTRAQCKHSMHHQVVIYKQHYQVKSSQIKS